MFDQTFLKAPMPRLVTLGSLAVLDDGDRLLGGTVRGRNAALLAVLARAGDAGVTRERLAALFWPESDASRARHSLDQAIYTVRRALGEVFRSGATTLALEADALASDVAEFATALEAGDRERAVKLYSGAFLDGFHVSKAPEFERWVDVERQALEGQYAEALNTLASRADEDGESELAVRYWRRLAATRPLSADVTIALMRSLEAAGDRIAAIEVSRVHAALVHEALGVAPDGSVAAYEHELRRRPEAAPPIHEPGVSDEVRTHSPVEARLPRLRDLSGGLEHGPVGPRGFGRRAWPWAASVLIVAAAVTATFGPRRAAERGPDVGALPRIAVSTFEDETGDPGLAPLGAMAADWITEGLVRSGLARVVDVGGRAEAIVSGRVYLSGDSVRLHGRVTSPVTGDVLRAVEGASARSADPTLAVQALQQRILGALGTLYDPRLASWAETSVRPPAYRAYQEFAAGVELFAMPRDIGAAAGRFVRATRLDPEFMAPRLWVAWAWMMAADYRLADSALLDAELHREAMSPLERAWHDRIRAVLDGDNEASLRAARRMAEIAPTSGWLLARANAAMDTNRPEEAIDALNEVGVANLGAEAGFGYFVLAAAHHQLGAHRTELEVAQEGIRVAGPSYGYLGPGVAALAALGRLDDLEQRLDDLRHAAELEGGTPAGIGSLGAAVGELRAHGFGEAAEALAARRLGRELDRAGGARPDGAVLVQALDILYETGAWQDAADLVDTMPDPGRSKWMLGMRGRIAARLGDEAGARRAVAELAAWDDPFDRGECALRRAGIEAALGNHREALELLRDAFGKGQGAEARHHLHVSRDFDPLRTDPGFQRLVQPIG